jgi:hypothetical protein
MINREAPHELAGHAIHEWPCCAAMDRREWPSLFWTRLPSDSPGCSAPGNDSLTIVHRAVVSEIRAVRGSEGVPAQGGPRRGRARRRATLRCRSRRRLDPLTLAALKVHVEMLDRARRARPRLSGSRTALLLGERQAPHPDTVTRPSARSASRSACPRSSGMTFATQLRHGGP